jgi:hypothetical protein
MIAGVFPAGVPGGVRLVFLWFLSEGPLSSPRFSEGAGARTHAFGRAFCSYARTRALGVRTACEFPQTHFVCGPVRTDSFLNAGLFQPINFAIAATFGREVRRLLRFRHNRRNSRGSAGHRVAITAASLAMSLIAATANAECVVADPSPTPLNVRTAPSPYGRVIATLDNGQSVEIIDHATDNHLRPWVYVADSETGKPLGWVFREYIVCKGELH